MIAISILFNYHHSGTQYTNTQKQHRSIKFMHPGPTSPSSVSKLSRLYKHSRKSLQNQIVSLFQEKSQVDPVKEKDEIFVQSEEDRDDHKYMVKLQNNSALFPTLKVQSPEEHFSSSWSQGGSLSISSQAFIKSHKNTGQDLILLASKFKRVSQTDFKLYMTFLTRTKLYGGMLMDCAGKVLWCDKKTHQILEGSFNNFERMTITSLLLNSQLENFLSQLKSIVRYDEKTVVQWIIYSKNMKRKYKKVPISRRPNNRELFYHFLKAVSVRIRPVSICLPDYRDPNGFCHKEFSSRTDPFNCFFLELRPGKRPPEFNQLDLIHDPIIRRYINLTRYNQYHKFGLERQGHLGEEEESLKFEDKEPVLKMEEGLDQGKRMLKRNRVDRVVNSLQRVQKSVRKECGSKTTPL